MGSKYLRILRQIVLDNRLTNVETKIFFYLIGESRTATMLAEELGIAQPTASKAAVRLQKLSLLKEDRTEGRNKFLTANLDNLLKAERGW